MEVTGSIRIFTVQSAESAKRSTRYCVNSHWPIPICLHQSIN